ncbi:MAG: (d)CMP kinase [Firmicutes bacterium]|nr:(d)CMP kinase [Bacillota bacterium]MCL2256080.1 (d)CMP kinase [Bacillota bacterium]
MKKTLNIAIDGPAGSGKSTVAKIVAKELGIAYLDTGAMYRALGLKSHSNNISVFDENAVGIMLEKTCIDIKYEDGIQRLFLDGVDVGLKIRENHISQLASDISKNHAVRLAMVELQRKIAEERDCVLDGRDIGSFVLPNAKHKIFLTASIDERAKRRHKELLSRGETVDINNLKQDIAKRDDNDMMRDFAPLIKAPDAIEVDTTTMTIEEVVNHILNQIKG